MEPDCTTQKQERLERKKATQWKPGQSGNPGGRMKGVGRPLVDAAVKFYRDNPDKLRELVDTMHRGAIGEIEITPVQVAAFQALQRVVDQMHRKQDGTDRQVLEQITVIVPTDGRKPERAGLTIEAAAQSRPVLELPHDPTDPLDPRNAPHADPPAP